MIGQKKRAAANPPSKNQKRSKYEKIRSIDGRHPLQKKVAEMCVMYQARIRPGAEVAYFNFDLAKEMGLIDGKHENKLTDALSKILIETFSLVIINEWDIEKKKTYDPKTIKEHPYMATRYLQLQHASKSGKTSGDGRSIWNGHIQHKGKVWDVSSCGTGATCLSPAAATHNKNFKTGDKTISYGCGLSDFDDGLMAALMSEILHRKSFPTERTLCVLKYKDNTSINVRVSQNLLRPAHSFRYLKLGDHKNLKAITDFHIEREQKNKCWNHSLKNSTEYEELLDIVCEDFAKSAAQYEREYIFCWFEWDGDNILTSGAGILDYGSIRQYGIFHKEYRYDDVERWSTTLLEQKSKAKYIVQSFAQLIDFIESGEKKSLKDYQSHPILKQFEKRFEHYKKFFLLKKIGLGTEDANCLIEKQGKKVRHLEKLFEHFERVQTAEGVYEVDDGVTSDAIFCMRDLLRELPKLYMGQKECVDAETFIEIGKSAFAEDIDLKITPSRKRNIKSFQLAYMAIIEELAKNQGKDTHRVLLEITMRSSLINRPDFLTGNGVIRVTNFLSQGKRGTKLKQLTQLLPEFIKHQVTGNSSRNQPAKTRDEMRKMIALVHESREDI